METFSAAIRDLPKMFHNTETLWNVALYLGPIFQCTQLALKYKIRTSINPKQPTELAWS